MYCFQKYEANEITLVMVYSTHICKLAFKFNFIVVYITLFNIQDLANLEDDDFDDFGVFEVRT